MDLEYAMFANGAGSLGDGRLSIFGADFSGVQAGSFPCMVPPFVLIVRLRLNVGEDPNGHLLRIDLVKPNGDRQTVSQSQIAAISNENRPDLPAFAHVFVNVAMSFDRPGDYVFDVFVDGQAVNAKPFYVTEG